MIRFAFLVHSGCCVKNRVEGGKFRESYSDFIETKMSRDVS